VVNIVDLLPASVVIFRHPLKMFFTSLPPRNYYKKIWVARDHIY